MKPVPRPETFRWFLGLAALAAGAAAACNSDRATGPSQAPSPVIRAFPNACVPQVISTVTDSTETDLVTFDSIGVASCYPDLVAWGMDMADPVGVDTPQGDATWQMRTDAVANLPSGAYYARNDNGSGGQNMIEFDPPVSSVSFYYSRLQGTKAWWNGVLVSQTDSMMVYARSRIPGTTFYNDWDSRKLYSNVPSTTPPWSVWTPVTLSASGDKIQWLWFDGNLQLDNLQITRKPLSCTGAQRGQQATCQVTPSGATVTSWEFVPDSSYGSLPTIQDTTSDTTWSGTVAASGKVTVHLTDGVTPRTFSARLQVTDRPSLWQANWTYRAGPEATLPDVEPIPGANIGRNCPESMTPCTIGTLWIHPDPVQHRGAGFVEAQIQSGPNRGYWYVSTTLYDMKRVGNVIPSILSSSTRTHTLAPPVPNQCRHALGFGKNDTVIANFNLYNDKCQNIDMSVFVAAALGHEGRGYGGGNGHQSLAEASAGLPGHDPYATIDTLVFADSATLESVVHSAVVPMAVAITDSTADPKPSGNYAGGPIWMWDTTSSAYILQTLVGF